MWGFNKSNEGTAKDFSYKIETRIINGKEVEVKVYDSQAKRIITVMNKKNRAAPCGKSSFNN